MSPPPLPDAFGNYALGDFVEIVAPASVNWLPQTSGWLWLGALLLVLLARYSWRRLREWYANRYRREATIQLLKLALVEGEQRSVMDINHLLKLTALAAFSREQVARLSGFQWVEFLNGQCESAPFTNDLGELLAVGAYAPLAIDDNKWQALLGACLCWVRTHEVRRDV